MKYLKRKILVIVSLFICAVMAFTLFACTPQSSDTTAGNDDNNTTNGQEESDNLPNGEDVTPPPPTAKFADVGESYSVVVKPIYDAVQEILQDQIENRGLVLVNEAANPRVIGIRYFYGRSLSIYYRTDIHININGPLSEILEQEYSIDLENFGIDNGESYLVYYKFFDTELSLQTGAKKVYEETLLPLAKHSAELILKDYYENIDDISVRIGNCGKRIILKENSIYSEIYHKIVDALNVGLAERNYPLITAQNIEIRFGGNKTNGYYSLYIEVKINDLNYNFILSFNKDGEFSNDFILYYMGEPAPGYTTPHPDLLVPANDEYFDFFEQLKIEEMDFTNLEDSFKAYFDPTIESRALYEPCGDRTLLYF